MRCDSTSSKGCCVAEACFTLDASRVASVCSLDVAWPASTKHLVIRLHRDATHDVNDGTHDVNDGTHDVNDRTHDVNDRTHDVNDGTHDVNDGTHDVNDRTHDVNDATHDVNDATHDVNDATHDVIDAAKTQGVTHPVRHRHKARPDVSVRSAG